MSRQLWLLRHGDAEPHGARDDPERRLTPRGEEQARVAGVALAAIGLELEACWTSAKVRARDTARLACESLGVEPVEHTAIFSGFDAGDARELLEAADADGRVLVVGHEPDFAQVTHDLTGARIDLKKGGVVGIRVDGSRAELIVVMRPRELSVMAAAHEQPPPV